MFEDVIDGMKCGGSTAIYGAIDQACRLLEPLQARHPAASLRVLVLSDGLNNVRLPTSLQALQHLYDVNATCDAIIVGNNCDVDLRRIVAATGGQCFQILGEHATITIKTCNTQHMFILVLVGGFT